jgi:hypothetical protein
MTKMEQKRMINMEQKIIDLGDGSIEAILA